MANRPSYATVEQIMAATDFKTSAYQTAKFLRLARSASTKVQDRVQGRRFYPRTETRSYVTPPIHAPVEAQSSGFWLEEDLLSLTSVTADGVAQTVADVELWPASGPPYAWIGVTGAEISVVGVWGYSQDAEAAGATAEALDDSETAVDVTDESAVGIGDLIVIDSERMLVTAKTQFDTGQDLQTDLTASDADQTVAVTDGTVYTVGEVILLESERMKIVDIAGNNLTVKRAWDGSTLAAHTGAVDIYAPRTLTVERAAQGSTAATHLTAAAITRNVPPGPITDLTIAEAVNTYEQEASGYGRVIGSGEGTTEARGAGIHDIRKAVDRYKRRRVKSI